MILKFFAIYMGRFRHYIKDAEYFCCDAMMLRARRRRFDAAR